MLRIRSLRLLLFGLGMLALAPASSAQVSVGVSVRIAPPALPVYAQPVCPGDGYIWTPGYWGYGPEGYYWVPGTWVMAPRVGFLWTPGYWGWGGGGYLWHAGYWGPHVGFYGGINYGFGYVGVGYAGGYWSHGVFAYNRAVNNVNVTNVHNTYNKTVINNVTVNCVSYNGGRGGTVVHATRAEESAGREEHFQPTVAQSQHERAASSNRAQFTSVNHGRPSVAATARPVEFTGGGVVAAKRVGGRNSLGPSDARSGAEATHAASYRPPAERRNPGSNGNRSGNVVHANPAQISAPRLSNRAGGQRQDRTAPDAKNGAKGPKGGGEPRSGNDRPRR